MEPRVVVCFGTTKKRRAYFNLLMESLKQQTYKNLLVCYIEDVVPIGRAKSHVVTKALTETDAEIICMVDDDDVLMPTYIEEVVRRLSQGDVDWVFTWGRLIGDRQGYIHGEIEPTEELLRQNHHRPSWISAKRAVFEKYSYNPQTDYAEDWELWIKLDQAGMKGAVIQKELYLKRWHNDALTVTHAKKDKPILHFIDCGQQFGYLYYLAIITALKTQDIAGVMLWINPEIKSWYLDLLRGKVQIRVLPSYDFPALKGKDAHFRGAHIKDYLSFKVLYQEGGIYFDLDTISLQDITGLLTQEETVITADMKDWHTLPYPFTPAIMGARRGSPFMKAAMGESEKRLQQENINWGDTGPLLVSQLAKTKMYKYAVPPFGVASGYFGGYAVEDIAKIFGSAESVVNPNARVLHYYAAYSRNALALMDEDMVQYNSCLFSRTIRAHFPKELYAPTWSVPDWLRRRGIHYKPMFDYLGEHACTNIMEIGTYNGENAVGMIKTTPAMERHISYYGFDLFMREHDTTLENTEVTTGYHKNPGIERVQQYIAQSTSATIRLYQGDSKLTIPKEAQGLPIMDFIYIDGGHSIDTIRADFRNIAPLCDKNTVIFLDDCFMDAPNIGCLFLYNELDRTKWRVERFSEEDRYGMGRDRLLAVRKL